jgi:predicted Ser/Thr protein kinase
MERVEPRTLLRLARASVVLSVLMVLGNVATRFGMPADSRGLYDAFLGWNLPGHAVILATFGSIVFTPRELERVRLRLVVGIVAAAWTVVVGTWLVGGPAATLNLAFATIIVGISRVVLGTRLGLYALLSVIGFDIGFALLRAANALPNRSPIPDYVLDHGGHAAVLVAWRSVAVIAVFVIAGYVASRKAAYEERLKALEVGTESTVLAGDDALSSEKEPVPGSRIGRYEVLSMVGAGGMGVVVRANDPELAREVAIKLVRPASASAEARARLLREARALARLRHPAVVPIYDVGTMGNQVFVVMPFLSGGTLGDWLRKERRPWRDVVERFLGAARGLSAAHASGLVHRDFKPDNVLIGDDGAVMIADFGLARPGGEQGPKSPISPTAPLGDITRTGEIVGTPAYMAPEQLTASAVDARTDVFAFSLAMWEGLFQSRPFDANTAIELLAKIHAGAPAPSDPNVPIALVEVLRKNLAYSPDDRAASMDALIAEIQRTISVPMP